MKCTQVYEYILKVLHEKKYPYLSAFVAMASVHKLLSLPLMWPFKTKQANINTLYIYGALACSLS